MYTALKRIGCETLTFDVLDRWHRMDSGDDPGLAIPEGWGKATRWVHKWDARFMGREHGSSRRSAA